MIKRRIQKFASPLVWLQLLVLPTVVVYSLSISSSTNNKNGLTSSTVSARNSQSYQQQTLANNQQQMTTLPPLMSTISQSNYLDSVNQAQQVQDKQETVGPRAGNELRSNNEEHDDAVPQATVNNHSRNNQPAPRPPQYVDVSALVGVSIRCKTAKH